MSTSTTETQSTPPDNRLPVVEDLEHARQKAETGVRNAMAHAQALIALTADGELQPRDFQKLCASLRFSYRYLHCLESYLEVYAQAEDDGRLKTRRSAPKAEEPIQ